MSEVGSDNSHDDAVQSASIADDLRVFRKVNPKRHLVNDNSNGGQRLSTKVFALSNADKTMSVELEDCILNTGKPIEEYLISPPYLCAISLLVSVIRAVNLDVRRSPNRNSPCHGGVFRVDGGRNLSNSHKNHLFQNYEWVCEPDEVS